jgi:hypothetical protein
VFRHRTSRQQIAVATLRNPYFEGKPRRAESIVMSTAIEPLLLDLVDWLAEEERTYSQVEQVCPRDRSTIPIWKEATRRGWVTTKIVDGRCIAKPTWLGLILGELRRKSQETRTAKPI